MSLNRTYFSVDVSETDRNRSYWASRPNLSSDTKNGISSAEIVFVPWVDRGKEGVSFPAGTTDLFRVISQHLGRDKVAIAVDRSEYQELSLHADELRWPTLLVATFAINTLANVIGPEITRVIHSESTPAIIELTTVVESEHGKCISITYKGPPSRLIETLVREVHHCLPSDSKNTNQLGANSIKDNAVNE